MITQGESEKLAILADLSATLELGSRIDAFLKSLDSETWHIDPENPGFSYSDFGVFYYGPETEAAFAQMTMISAFAKILGFTDQMGWSRVTDAGDSSWTNHYSCGFSGPQ